MPQYEKTPIIMITSEAAKYTVIEAIKVVSLRDAKWAPSRTCTEGNPRREG